MKAAIDSEQLRMLHCAAKVKLEHLVRCAENTISARMQEATLEKAMAVYQALAGEEAARE